MTCNFVKGLNCGHTKNKRISMVKKNDWKIDGFDEKFVLFFCRKRVGYSFMFHFDLE